MTSLLVESSKRLKVRLLIGPKWNMNMSLSMNETTKRLVSPSDARLSFRHKDRGALVVG